jgi:uncharacterized membrane-anchored protein YjiN (DUF445 family)
LIERCDYSKSVVYGRFLGSDLGFHEVVFTISDFMAGSVGGSLDLKLKRLRKMRRLAGALLLLMVALFLASKWGAVRFPFLEWVQAFAEAAMVGALADWFAVVALFRRPLGLAIPHTGILPARKAQIARSLADFMVENFLNPEEVRRRIQGVEFSDIALGWLRSGAPELAAKAGIILHRFIEVLDHKGVAEFIHSQLLRKLESIPLAPLAGELLELLTSGGKHEVLLEEVLRQCQRLLLENEEPIRRGIEEEVPLPAEVLGVSLKAIRGPIAGYVAGKLMTRVLGVIDAALQEGDHALRRRFTDRVGQFVVELKASPEYLTKGEAIKRGLLANPLLRDYSAEVWADIRAKFSRLGENSGRGGAVHLEALIEGFAKILSEDVDLKAGLNRWIRGEVEQFVETHRFRFGRIIEETINSWDGQALSEKMELEVGADLQFIRISGTFIGGLVGVGIHALSRLLG